MLTLDNIPSKTWMDDNLLTYYFDIQTLEESSCFLKTLALYYPLLSIPDPIALFAAKGRNSYYFVHRGSVMGGDPYEMEKAGYNNGYRWSHVEDVIDLYGFFKENKVTIIGSTMMLPPGTWQLRGNTLKLISK